MFGHAFKGQTSGLKLLKRFKAEMALYDLEYLTDPGGRRLAAWVLGRLCRCSSLLKAYADQQNTKGICRPVSF